MSISIDIGEIKRELTLESALFLLLTQHFVRSRQDIGEVGDQDLLGNVLVCVAGVLLECGDKLVVGLECNGCNLRMLALRL